MPMSTYWSGNSTSTANTYYIETESIISPRPSRSKWEFNSKPLGAIVKAKILAGKVAIFAHRNSPCYKDTTGLECYSIQTYYNDPIMIGFDEPTRLICYDFAIILDALEYIPDRMSKANVIKEALSVLNPDRSNPKVIILSKTPEMIEKIAEEDGYEKVDAGFLINKKSGKFCNLIARGLSVDELIDIAHFAGAQYIEEDKSIETDLACIRISLHKQG
jgi:hypothetical protein